MFKNYCRLAWRNLSANRGYTLINIIGLAVGLSVCLFILLFIFHETSYDQQQPGIDRLYRVGTSFKSKVDQSSVVSSNALIAAGLKAEMPEVEQAARLLTAGTGSLVLDYTNGTDHKLFYEKKGYYVDAGFLDLFRYQWLRGDPKTAMNAPNTAVVSADLATRLFGKADPMGRTFRTGAFQSCTFTITGVVRPVGPSHIDGDLLLNMDNEDLRPWLKDRTNWATYNTFLTYIRLKEGTDVAAFSQKLNPFLRSHGSADITAAGAERLLFLQPVKEIHLHTESPYDRDISVNISKSYLYILGCIALFVLVIACVNFMNLATARSQRRAKEVGVRKVMGALRISLVAQFLGESLFISVISLGLALLLVYLFLPAFNLLAQRELSLFEHPGIVGWVVGLALFTGLLAGAYPALYLSSFRPIRVLKGQLVNSLSALFLRKGLVVFQFTISVFLILASLLIWQQLNFLNRHDLGFQKDQQLVIPLRTQQAQDNFTALKEAIGKDPHIVSMAGGTTYPGQTPSGDLRFYREDQSVADGANIPLGEVGYDFLQTLGMTIISGRAFSREFPSDSSGFIFNESAIRRLGLDPQTAVGKYLNFDQQRHNYKARIVGIVRDFNFQSLREPIHPYGFGLDTENDFLFAHVNTRDYPSLISRLSVAWSRINPGVPFEYSFMDQDFQRTYEQEYRMARIIGVFTLFTIVIACLGLFGLAAFSAEQRIREIGIRKVLGCSLTGITALLSTDFIRLVMIAILIASPLAWFAMNRWLQDFSYRVPIHWWLFVIAGCLAVGIALVTVCFQALKAARMSPVKSLRAE